MEKLNGIHQDVEIRFITTETANLKFPKLAEIHALRYLRSIASSNTFSGYQECKAIINKMEEENSLEPIWDEIKQHVARKLWDEFKDIYGNNRDNKFFTNLIDFAWQFLEAPKVLPPYIKLQLLAAERYLRLQMRALFNASQYLLMNRLHEHSLWANRHASGDAQKDFDKRFGLVRVPSK